VISAVTVFIHRSIIKNHKNLYLYGWVQNIFNTFFIVTLVIVITEYNMRYIDNIDSDHTDRSYLFR